MDVIHLNRFLEGRLEAGRHYPLAVFQRFGHLHGLETLLEASISPDGWLAFETHSHMEAARIRCGDYERLERPRRLRLIRAGSD